jgi:hypothetical protein
MPKTTTTMIRQDEQDEQDAQFSSFPQEILRARLPFDGTAPHDEG